jgi:NitT/TauT family transport system substrate-binding protein
LLAAGLCLPIVGLFACTRPTPLVRVAGIVWIGYEPLFLARELGFFDAARVRLVETPSNTASLMALATGDVEAATLTLDEFLIAREGGLDVRIILVFDDSAGADVVMVRPEIKTLADLRGKRIGVEDTAVGALMLARLLEVAEIKPVDIVKVSVTSDRHVAAFQAHQVDALVSFEPHATQLAGLGATRLLDSRRFPGLVVDVLAARASALDAAPDQFRRLTDGYFRTLDYLRRSPDDAAARMAPRMGISPQEALQALKGVRMMDRIANRAWLDGPEPSITSATRFVATTMRQTGLLRSMPSLDHLADPRFLTPDAAEGRPS